jgi:hypothetical protein
MVMVNLPSAGVDYHVPFGGRKGASFGPRDPPVGGARRYEGGSWASRKTRLVRPFCALIVAQSQALSAAQERAATAAREAKFRALGDAPCETIR